MASRRKRKRSSAAMHRAGTPIGRRGHLRPPGFCSRPSPSSCANEPLRQLRVAVTLGPAAAPCRAPNLVRHHAGPAPPLRGLRDALTRRLAPSYRPIAHEADCIRNGAQEHPAPGTRYSVRDASPCTPRCGLVAPHDTVNGQTAPGNVSTQQRLAVTLIHASNTNASCNHHLSGSSAKPRLRVR